VASCGVFSSSIQRLNAQLDRNVTRDLDASFCLEEIPELSVEELDL